MSAVMNLSMNRASVPVFLRALQILDTLLDKAEAHERAAGLAPNSLVEARLADDMLPLSGQVQRASDASKLAAVRLTGATFVQTFKRRHLSEYGSQQLAFRAAELNELHIRWVEIAPLLGRSKKGVHAVQPPAVTFTAGAHPSLTVAVCDAEWLAMH